MLKAKQAREKRETVRRENGEGRRLASLARLPRKLAEVGRGLLGQDARGRALNGRPDRHRATALAGARLDGLPGRERRQLFEALFPRVAACVDAAWELTYQMPYEGEPDHKAFRAPEDPAVTRPARLRWFQALLHELEGYEQDVTWLAARAGFLCSGYGAEAVALVLAAAINAGGKEGNAVFDTLCDSARGCHPVGVMARHVSRALLIASRPEGWELVARLLLDAQGQEGMLQAILEAVGEAHPEAFRRMLRLIMEHDLSRLGPVVRALDVWLGFQWDAVSTRVVNRVLERVTRFLGDPRAQARSLESDDSETVYLALWTMAFEDAPAAVKPAAALLTDPGVERRFIAAHLLSQLHLPAARAALVPALDDSDLRVALCALEGCEGDEQGEGPDLFEPLERLLARMPARKQFLEPIVWPWHVFSADRQAVAGSLLDHLGGRPPAVLIPHLSGMESWARRQLVERIAGTKKWDDETRAALFGLLGDPSITVREAAFKALSRCTPSEAEAVRLEELLTRKPADLRRGALDLLLGQKDVAALASADRLLASPAASQRQAGLELLRRLAEAGRAAGPCRARAEAYRTGRPKRNGEEQKQLDAILHPGRAPVSLDQVLGLMDGARRPKRSRTP